MKKQISPAAVAAIIVVAVAIIGGVIWKMTAGSGYEAKTSSQSEQAAFMKSHGIAGPGGTAPGGTATAPALLTPNKP